jgi:hypothetical protein
MKYRRRVLIIAVLPVMHLLLCLFAVLTGGRNSWNWIWVLMVDMPVAYFVRVAQANPFCLTLIGTAWWLCIGFAISWLISWLIRRASIPRR